MEATSLGGVGADGRVTAEGGILDWEAVRVWGFWRDWHSRLTLGGRGPGMLRGEFGVRRCQ